MLINISQIVPKQFSNKTKVQSLLLGQRTKFLLAILDRHKSLRPITSNKKGLSTLEEIIVSGLTKNYGHGRGIYDVSFEVHKGEVFGFLGPNGAGKSTTMRHLMGFSKPQSGEAKIHGLSCWKDHARIMNRVGYIPGEVALPDGLNGNGFLQMMQGLRKSPDTRTAELLALFQMNPNASMKRMSIGEKRKLAVVAAFMGNPDILLLDEPTSGLDPVMQEIFIDFVQKEREKGKTALLSSHIFSEVEALCDRIAIIKEGRIISVVNAEEVKHFKRKTFDITFSDEEGYRRFPSEGFEIRESFPEEKKLSAAIDDAQCDRFIKCIVKYKVKHFVEHQQTLEDYFMHFYKSDRSFGGITNAKRNRH